MEPDSPREAGGIARGYLAGPPDGFFREVLQLLDLKMLGAGIAPSKLGSWDVFLVRGMSNSRRTRIIKPPKYGIEPTIVDKRCE